MRTNCPLCGHRLSVEELRDRENTIIAPNGVEIVICSRCGERKKELEKKVRGASPKQLEILTTKSNESLIDAILRERAAEQAAPIALTPPKKDEHGCVIGREKWNLDLHQCVKIEFEKPKCPPGTVWNDDLHQCVKIEQATPTEEHVGR